MPRSRIPALGPRGEGWVAGQLVLLLAVAITGAFALRDPALTGPTRWVVAAAGLALIALGGTVTMAGLRDLGPNLTATPRPRPGGQLVAGGIYRYLRHPIYAGICAGALGWSFLAASPIAAILALALAGWFDLKARREEQWLAEHYPDYAAFASRTRRFIPGVY